MTSAGQFQIDVSHSPSALFIILSSTNVYIVTHLHGYLALLIKYPFILLMVIPPLFASGGPSLSSHLVHVLLVKLFSTVWLNHTDSILSAPS